MISADPGLLGVLAVILKRAFVVTRALTISEGYRFLALARPPDAVIVDLPAGDLDLVFFLRSLRHSVPRCPVLVLGDSSLPDPTPKLASLEINGFFRKPIRVNALLSRLGALLSADGRGGSALPVLSPPVASVIEYVAQHYRDRLTVDLLARAGSVSASHLAFLFSAEIGTSVKDYVTIVRIEIAKHTLRATSEKLDQIAERTGFCDASHLYRAFRRHAGRSPGGYRRAVRETGGGPPDGE